MALPKTGLSLASGLLSLAREKTSIRLGIAFMDDMLLVTVLELFWY